ncbi:hypothetical protein ABH935_006475 [Catenulispora sp. GAS73]|uniref:hypothetical protein n=1 Tax=Catenulispora sp. GAS73 TaxID=3156269 RepID=UPI00351259EB
MARLPHFPATPQTSTLTRAVREWSGWLIVAAGAVLCVLGWYGVSGESVIEQQLPYLASATIPGAAMIVAGATLIASRPSHRTAGADQRIETLYALLVADPTEPATTPRKQPAAPEALLAVPGGTLYHRRDCPLVADKPTAEPIDTAAIIERSLTPCPVCEPPPPGPGRSGPDHPAPTDPATSGPAPSEGEHTDQRATDQRATDRPATDQRATDQRATDRPATDQRATNQRATDRPATDQRATDRPATDPAASGPAPAADQPADPGHSASGSGPASFADGAPAADQLAADQPAADRSAADPGRADPDHPAP